MILPVICFLTLAPFADLDSSPNPRIGMLWSAHEGKGDYWEKANKYSLVLVGPDALGLEWQANKYPALATKLETDTTNLAKLRIQNFGKHNPASQLIVETYFFEANIGDYPPESPWWYRDEKGKKVQFWEGCYNMATDNPEYVQHVADRIEAIASISNGVTGTYLDNLRFDQKSVNGWQLLLKKIRNRRPNFFIMVNAGWSSTNLEWISKSINGLMYEDSVHHTSDGDQEKFYARLARHDSLMKKPTRSINEVFGKRSDLEMPWRELYRTLVYTDAAYLYSDSTFGHKHNWREEWNPRLGLAQESLKTPNKKFQSRKFQYGTVFWNPTKFEIKTPLTQKMIDLRSGKALKIITLAPNHGAILLNQN